MEFQASLVEGSGVDQVKDAAALMDVDAKAAEEPMTIGDVPKTEEGEIAEDMPQV